MEANSRQEVINLLHSNGISLTGNNIDKIVKDINNFSMPLSERFKWCLQNKEEFLSIVEGYLVEE